MRKALLDWERIEHRMLKCGPYRIFRVVHGPDIGVTYLALKHIDRGVSMLGNMAYDNAEDAKRVCESDWEDHAYKD